MLQADLGARYLTLVCLTTKLPVELGALRKARGTERMTLTDQTT